MKVLVLGMPRTGTQSLAGALAELDITPTYHMREVFKNKQQVAWIKAIEAKYEGKGTPSGREQFDELFAGYEAVADYPAAIFPNELLTAYPEAAVILTTRGEDAWYASMMSTLVHAHLHAPRQNPSLAAKYHTYCWKDDFPTYGREAYRRQNEVVREAAKGRRFLEYETGSGWGPLCEFLGVDVPEVPYPRSDDWVAYKQEVKEKEKLARLAVEEKEKEMGQGKQTEEA
ncbi:hypothetical protein JX266_013680 [Neoarthrinium moseri]|nr:hypothetical protein JX266_013680 [Neoarthrinium moseri]